VPFFIAKIFAKLDTTLLGCPESLVNKGLQGIEICSALKTPNFY